MAEELSSLLTSIDMRNFSGQISEIVRQEFNKMEIQIAGKSPELLRVLNDAEARKKYLLQYQEQLKTTFSGILPKEIILQVDKSELGDFVNDALRKFKVSTGGKFVDELLSPVLSSSILTYTQDTINEHLAENKEELNKLISSAISVLAKKGVKIKEIAESELVAKLMELQNRLPAHFLNETLLNNLVESAKDLIKNRPSDIIISTEEKVETIFSEQFENLKSKAEDAARKSFKALGEGIKVLTDNELQVNETLDKFREEILERSKQIGDIESKINSLLKNAVPDLNELAKKQIEHAKLVAENLFHTNVINSYLKNGIRIIESIDSFKDKAAKLFSGETLNNFRDKLDALKKPTFSGVVSFASETINTLDQISGTMEKLGIFKGAAKSVGKFVNYAKVAIAVATVLLPPNPIGIIGALGSLGGLFGGGGPSIEEQMFEAMQQGFNQLNERLDQIEAKIDRLTEVIQTMYKNLMESLRIISNQLQQIKEQLDLNDQRISLIIYKDYNLVEEVINAKNGIDSDGLELYKRWFNKITTSFAALSELDKLTLSSKNLRQVIRKDFTQPGEVKSIQVIGEIELTAYNKSLQLLKKFFPTIESNDKIKNLLLLPAQKNTFRTFQQGFNLMEDKSIFNFESATENYFNSSFLIRLVEQYIILHPFFILSRNSQFEPFATIKELLSADSQQMIKDKLGPSKGRLNNLLEAINSSIIQQSILAGCTMLPFINNALFGNDETNFQDVVDAIKSNELLAKNVAVFFIHTKIDGKDLQNFTNLCSLVKSDKEKLKDLNVLLKNAQGRLQFEIDDRNPANPMLCLAYTKPGSTEKIPFPVPDLTIIEEKQMIYSNALYSLLVAKEKVIIALIDIGFFQNLSGTQSNVYKEVFT